MNELRGRLLGHSLASATAAFPVVVLAGARQTGKTTLVQHLAPARGRAYRTLDDLRVLDLAEREPDLLVREAERLTIDEVQRAPDLLRAIKRAVDEQRRPGRYLLTGSANLLLMSNVSETLAGRAIYLRLGPLTESEKARRTTVGAWDGLLAARSADEALRALQATPALEVDWTEAACQGGFPPVLDLSPDDRTRWFEGYVATYLERDLQQLAQISALSDYRRLLEVAALRLGGLLNQADLARDAALSRPTAHRYLSLLQVAFHARLLRPYAKNRGKRLVKAPKLFFTDTGLAAHLAGALGPDEIRAAGPVPARGAFLENLLLSHIDVWREHLIPRPEIYFYRTADGMEVDLVIEHRRRLIPIEVKSSTRVGRAEIGSLQRFMAEHRAPWALVVYTGAQAHLAAPNIVAAPVTALL